MKYVLIGRYCIDILFRLFSFQQHAQICKTNETVEEEIRNLVREKEELERILHEHHCTQKVQA